MNDVRRSVPNLDPGTAKPIVLPRIGDGSGDRGPSDPIPIRVRRGCALFRDGDPLSSIYRVHAGDFKLVRVEEDGFERVIDFVGPDELLGLESLESGRFVVTAIALQDSLVHAMPLERPHGAGRTLAAFDDRIRLALATRFDRLMDASWLMSALGADRRTARYLVLLSRRMGRRGLSPTRLVLRMRRRDISSYIGLCHESVSRAFTVLVRDGLLRVRGREIEILDLPALERFADVNRSRFDGTSRTASACRAASRAEPVQGRVIPQRGDAQVSV